MTATSFFTIAAGIVAVFALAIYFFGIPPEYKRKLEKQALKTMGENKMSYMAKGTLASNTLIHSDFSPVLTSHRPNQQDPHLRPGRRQEPEEEHRQHARRRREQSHRRDWRRGC
jgi:hypothetical protein